jgi:hypothetical protein
MNFAQSLDAAAEIGRWVARVLGSLLALMFLAFFIGEGIAKPSELTFREALTLLGFVLAIIGLTLAWFRPALGGGLAMAGYLLHASITPRSALNPIIAAVFVAGALHVVCWARLHVEPAQPAARWRIPKPVLLGGGAVLGVFIILAVNEAFGMPPLMTPVLRPAPELSGEWIAQAGGSDVRLTVHPDGSVTGTISDAALTNARIINNRSWFGRLMNWRTPYLIMGGLSHTVRLSGRVEGAGFTAPLTPAAGRLRGVIFLNRLPVSLLLRRPSS